MKRRATGSAPPPRPEAATGSMLSAPRPRIHGQPITWPKAANQWASSAGPAGTRSSARTTPNAARPILSSAAGSRRSARVRRLVVVRVEGREGRVGGHEGGAPDLQEREVVAVEPHPERPDHGLVQPRQVGIADEQVRSGLPRARERRAHEPAWRDHLAPRPARIGIGDRVQDRPAARPAAHLQVEDRDQRARAHAETLEVGVRARRLAFAEQLRPLRRRRTRTRPCARAAARPPARAPARSGRRRHRRRRRRPAPRAPCRGARRRARTPPRAHAGSRSRSCPGCRRARSAAARPRRGPPRAAGRRRRARPPRCAASPRCAGRARRAQRRGAGRRCRRWRRRAGDRGRGHRVPPPRFIPRKRVAPSAAHRRRRLAARDRRLSRPQRRGPGLTAGWSPFYSPSKCPSR